MKIWEYTDATVDQESLLSMLNEKGKECWECLSVIPAQKVINSKLLGGQPEVQTFFHLIFKR